MNWEKVYRQKVTDNINAVACVESNQSVYIGGGAGAPASLVDGLVARAADLKNVELLHILTFIGAPYIAPHYSDAFRHNALFIGPNVRQAVQEGRADFTPVFLSEIPRLFRNKIIPLDVALITVSPPDEHGFCSFGVEVGSTKPAAESANLIVAEVNPNMPRTLGDSFIHVSQIDHIVEANTPLPEAPLGGASPTHLKIGQLIAEIIPDGATLQMGIGSIPDAVLQALTNHKHIGVHTELFSDGVIDLVEAGIITCRQKTFHPGKIVAGFLFGSQKLYDFVDNNPLIELHPTDYVNDPFNIAQNEKMVAINSALQVDLTGQVAADSMGPRFFSGVGGQVDFMRGAARSKGGKPIIALPATAKGGTLSRIVPTLYPGSGVTTTRNEVHYIVTEFGVAYLYGKSVRQRAEALINISHPDFRDQLRHQAHEVGYL
ncbi:MAG TPA: acetyl-CoA hydrolase/transferase C-terminal domain-containing protein [Anaerolineae bacterium]|nr:acetyl-CoA hydrolase/transferase C-terminal domain-containing protein [Anaerolineae bacterium]